MIQKLKQLEQIKSQERIVEQVQITNSSPLIQNLIQSAINESHKFNQENKVTEINVKCSVLEKMTFQNQEADLLRENKLQLLKKVNLMSQMNHPLLAQYFGVQVVQKGDKMLRNSDGQQLKESTIKAETELRLLGEQNLIKFESSRWRGQPKTKEELLSRIMLCRQLIQAVAIIHEHEYSFFPQNVDNIILLAYKNHLKLATHKLKFWRDTTEKDIQEIRTKQSTKLKTSALSNRSIKYISPEFIFKNTTIKDIRCNDVWKVGLQVFTLLTGQDFSKEVLGLENIEEDKANTYKIIPQDKLKMTLISELMKALHFVPSERKPLAQLLKDFVDIETQMNEQFTLKTLQASKKQYIKKQEQNTVKFMLELKATEELLSQDNKKKLIDYFKTVHRRPLKKFQPLLRASQSSFSSRCFYEAASEKKHLLVVIQQKKEKKKIICYSEESFDLNKGNGIFGGFVKDNKKMSFIFSPQQNEFCRLKNTDKAIGVSYTQGPIIGDGDLMISDGAIHNTCRFPSSYEPSGKLKKLLKSDIFEVEEYDLYQVWF